MKFGGPRKSNLCLRSTLALTPPKVSHSRVVNVPQRVLGMGDQQGNALGLRIEMVPVFIAGTVEKEGVRKGGEFPAGAADSSTLLASCSGPAWWIYHMQLGGWV